MEEKSTVDGSEIQRENQLRLLVYLPGRWEWLFGISAINSSISGVPSRDPNSSPKGMEISIIFASLVQEVLRGKVLGRWTAPMSLFSNVLPNAVKG